MSDEIIELYLDDIIPNRFQPREKFDEDALRELSTSIKEHGVIQPIIVRKIGDKYEIIAGERRYKASALAGLTKIPVIIRNLDDKEASKVALLENLQRKDLTAIEEARTYQKILDLDSMTQEELGKSMGKSQAAIANKLRLLVLSDEVQEALLNDQISERHARSLLGLNNRNEQIEMLNRVIRERMTVRELDQEIRRLKEQDNTFIEKEIIEEPVIIEEPKSIVLEPINDKIDDNKDNMINIVENVNNDMVVEENKFINNDSSIDETFKIKEPNTSSFIPSFNPEELENNNEDKEYIEKFKYEDAINLVKNIIPEIKDKGINANLQEFDLDNKYQIIINIEK